MTHRATLRLSFDDEAQARRLLAAIAPENEPHLSASVEGATLVASAAASTPGGLLRTLDDALACLGAAMRAERVASASSPESPD